MIEFTLPDMSCGHCVKTITETIQGIDPTARIDVQLPFKRVRIESAEDPARFASALDEAGYPVA